MLLTQPTPAPLQGLTFINALRRHLRGKASVGGSWPIVPGFESHLPFDPETSLRGQSHTHAAMRAEACVLCWPQPDTGHNLIPQQKGTRENKSTAQGSG